MTVPTTTTKLSDLRVFLECPRHPDPWVHDKDGEGCTGGALVSAVLEHLLEALREEGVLVEERTGRMFPSETRKGILEYRDTERRYVTEWDPIPVEVEEE